MSNKETGITISRKDAEELGAIINCAVRYCLMRESYMPNLVMSFIRSHTDMLDLRTVNVMIRDIEEEMRVFWHDDERRNGRVFREYARQLEKWREFKIWLEEQRNSMEQRQRTPNE